MNDIDVVKHVKQLLQDRQMSNYRLAQLSGISKETINKLLREEHTPSIYTLIHLCRGLNISVGEFFAQIEAPSEQHTQLLTMFNSLSERQKDIVWNYMKGALSLELQ